jgi:hypothetical protein
MKAYIAHCRYNTVTSVPNVKVLRIRQVAGSNLGSEYGYLD